MSSQLKKSLGLYCCVHQDPHTLGGKDLITACCLYSLMCKQFNRFWFLSILVYSHLVLG